MNFHGILRVIERLEIPFVEELNGWVRTPCPFAPFRHAKGTDNKPGFGISIKDDEPSYYNCLACKSKGALSTLPMQLSHYRDDPSLIEFGKKLQEDEILGGGFEFGQWEERTSRSRKKSASHIVTNLPSEREFYSDFQSALNYPEAFCYLRQRGLSVNTIVALGLRYDPRQFRVLFPVYDQRTGCYAGCSGRSILSPRQAKRHEAEVQRRNPRFEYPKIRDYGGLQKDRVLLGPRWLRSGSHYANAGSRRNIRSLRASASRRIIVVEGLFAYAHTRQLRPGDIIVALLGSALTEQKALLLLSFGLPIYWLVDNDLAGQACLYGTYDKETDEFAHNKSGALYRLYGEVAQFVPEWPEGKSDPDELTWDELDYMISSADLWIA